MAEAANGKHKEEAPRGEQRGFRNPSGPAWGRHSSPGRVQHLMPAFVPQRRKLAGAEER